MHPKILSIRDFTYDLPPDRIATHPLDERDAARLLIYDGRSIREDAYRNLADFLPQDSLLVLNNTRVIAARLLFQKPSGGVVEIFCLEPHEQFGGIANALLRTASVTWMCWIGSASKWKPRQVLEKHCYSGETKVSLRATYAGKTDDQFAIELSWSPPSLTFAEVLNACGSTPLPPYIKRGAEIADRERYQTIYADASGSVAAPTAGLHFTPALLEAIHHRNISTEYVTLHVGAGTFQPVKAEKMEDHVMHAEIITVSYSAIQRIRTYANDNITAVGTTSLRTLESLYWLGVKVCLNPSLQTNMLSLDQWEAYELPGHDFSATAALDALMAWMNHHNLQHLSCHTRLLIAPGYTFQLVNGLVTNFHQPGSTLLLLVAAFVGDGWKEIYEYALNNGFRFLSYGDGCFFLRQ